MSNDSKSNDSKSYDSSKSEETNKKEDDNNSNVSKEFKEMVLKYVKLDDLMQQKQKEMSELRAQRKVCEEFILKYLDDVDQDEIEITNGRLKKKITETKVPINQDNVKEAVKEKVKNPKIIKDILDSVEKTRAKNVRVNLQRTTGKARNIKKKTK
jgi:hypothetical protein